MARAEWYPADGGAHSYYALCRISGRVLTLVVAIQQGLAKLITVYEPRGGWDKRLPHARPWPLNVVLALAA